MFLGIMSTNYEDIFKKGYIIGKYRVVHEAEDFYLVEVQKDVQKEPKLKTQKRVLVEQQTPKRTSKRVMKKKQIVIDEQNTDEEDQKHNSPWLSYAKDNYRKRNDITCEEDNNRKTNDITCEEDVYALMYATPDNRDKILLNMDDQKDNDSLFFYKATGETIVFSHKFTSIAEIEFIVTENHVLLSRTQSDLIFCSFSDDNEQFSIAPGCVDDFIAPKDENSEWMVSYRWLPENANYDPHVHTDIRTAVADGEISSLPLSAVLGTVMLLPTKTREDLMPNYSSSLRVLDSLTAKPVDDLIPVKDYIEFFHIANVFIWRTKLGELIMKKFLEPFMQFGTGKYQTETTAMISAIMSSGSFEYEETKKEKGVCDACNLPRTLGSLITIKEYEMDMNYFVGCDCRQKLIYLREIGLIIRTFRYQRVLNMEYAHIIISKMRDAQDVYRRFVDRSTEN
jgi:hypothetical protein